jgi:hypothetical protein
MGIDLWQSQGLGLATVIPSEEPGNSPDSCAFLPRVTERNPNLPISLQTRALLPLLLALLPLTASAQEAPPAANARPANQHGRITLMEENDSIYTWDDRYYTQGFAFTYLTPRLDADSAFNGPFDALSGSGRYAWLSPFGTPGQSQRRHYEIIFGQSIFTPERIHADNPPKSDRPYAGWLYTGIGMDQDTDHRQLDHLELLGGVVGPDSLGRTVQNDWHQFIGIGKAEGWDHQLNNEPGFMLSYERKWRFWQPLVWGQEVDAIPELGATLGNVMTYGEAGLTVRIGQNLRADYGQQRIRPASSGTAYFDPTVMESPFGWYFYAAVQGRAVGRNIFLDGNTFDSSRSVDKKPLVGDVSGGLALFWGDAVRLDGSVTYRSKEFEGQDENTIFAGLNLGFGF